MNKEILYATNNPGKVFEVARFLEKEGIKIISPKDLGINIDPAETGETLEENAVLKVRAYREIEKERMILADDTGVMIDALGGEPGIHVRRWQDHQTKMSDRNIIDYCLKRLKNVPKEKRGASFRTVLALNWPDGRIEYFDGILQGEITEKADELKIEGFPFESLFFVPEWNEILGRARQLNPTIREKEGKLNHREKALKKVAMRLKEIS